MMKKKGAAVIVSLALVIASVLPHTLAVYAGQDAGAVSGGIEVSAPEESVPEEPVCICDPQPADGEAHGEDCPLCEPAEGPDYEALYQRLMAAQTEEELDGVLAGFSEEELAAFEAWLAENGLTEELDGHLLGLESQEYALETHVFTEAGPFMPAISVQSIAESIRRAPRVTENTADNGIHLGKSVKDNKNGTYTITLESYTTGKVTTTTKTTPVDIVLVLDQSGSMAYDFDGNSTSTNANRRQYAMKQAVNDFINAVKEKYSDEADHRMAIVTFGSNASVLQSWTYVNDAGKDTLQGKISGLPDSSSGATNAGAGMTEAETLMGSGYNYTGTNTTRQKVVILFTDGVPTTATRFDVDVANTAITAAKNMKDAGVTVYSVGIFNGANPTQLHGDCNGNVGDRWGKTGFLWVGDVADVDQPAGNRFLNYVSTNFADTTEIGLKKADWWVIVSYKGWEITRNFDRTASNYYLTAADEESLKKIFTTISENIDNPSIDLGTEAVIQDIVSDYFELPVGTTPADIRIFTVDATASALETPDAPDAWGDAVRTNLTAAIDGKTIRATGFDYNANYVTKEGRGTNKDFYGKKLVIEFEVTVRNGFLGGNNVPTNGEASGIYENESAQTPLSDFDQPTVDVPIQDVNVTAENKNVYLKGTADQLKKGATVTVGGIPLDLLTKENYGLEPWQTAYVNITVTVKDKDGNAVTDRLADLTGDTAYTIEVTVAPKDTGTVKEKSGSDSADIHVFKPELTFQDSTAYYGEEVPAEYAGNLVSTVWKNGGKTSTDTGVAMLGTKPELTLAYTPDPDKIADKRYTKQDVPVKVTVRIGQDDVTGYTTFVHNTCTEADCNWTTPTANGNPAFQVHIRTCTLTITKEGGAADEPYVFDIYKDDKKYSEVTIVGNGRAVIVELPVGNYTIKENTAWSWRYPAPTYTDPVQLKRGEDSGGITCTNKKTLDFWLNGFSVVIRNIFGKKN